MSKKIKKSARKLKISKAKLHKIMCAARAKQLRTMNTKAYQRAAQSARTLNVWRKQNAA